MPISKNWALMRSWLRRTYNKEVFEFFRDLDPSADLDNLTGRSATKAVCLIGPNDSQGIAAQKQENFRYLRERSGLTAQLNHEWANLPGDSKKNKPQVQLWFHERKAAALIDNRKVVHKARIAFRIMEEWKLENAANPLALKIKSALVSPLFAFESGKWVAYYKDVKLGYEFQIYVENELEARRVIDKIMSIQGHAPNWRNLHMSEIPELQTVVEYDRVLGTRVELQPPRKRCRVYFRYAIAKIEPLKTDFPLVDVSGRYVNALYRAD